jgi:hypothetical protein
MRKTSMSIIKTFLCLSVWTAAIIFMAVPAQATFYEYYIGIDGSPMLTSGAYAGLANPNQGRLTFLFAHPNEDSPASSHYHGIGAYSYTGPASSPTVQSTNTNNRIPEISSGQGPLPLAPGSGMFEGRLVSQPIPGLEYSNLAIRSTQDLSGFTSGTPEAFLFTSSGGRWMGSLEGAQVALQLVSITDGLNLVDELGAPILLSPGDTHLLGLGNTLAFTPTFWTDGAAPSGTYSAQFRLLDLGSATGRSLFEQSGTFNVDFQVVPEPSTVTLMALGIGVLAIVSTRRRLPLRQSSMEA